MCFTINKNRNHTVKENEGGLEFHITRLNILIPILVSACFFVVEIRVYYVSGECVDWLKIFRLLNTTFIPTHIATATVFLYQHFSLSNTFNINGKIQSLNDMEIRAENAVITLVSTVLLALFYTIFSFGANLINQFFLFFIQFVYMVVLWKHGIRERVIVYKDSVKNVVSY